MLCNYGKCIEAHLLQVIIHGNFNEYFHALKGKLAGHFGDTRNSGDTRDSRATGGGMCKPRVEGSIPAAVLMSHYFQLTPGPGRKESIWVSRLRKSVWLKGLSNRRALTLPRLWWMNERGSPLRSSSDKDSFPSPPPGFLLQEEKGEKQILFLCRAQRGHGTAIPLFSSSPPCWHVAAAEVVSCYYEM